MNETTGRDCTSVESVTVCGDHFSSINPEQSLGFSCMFVRLFLQMFVDTVGYSMLRGDRSYSLSACLSPHLCVCRQSIVCACVSIAAENTYTEHSCSVKSQWWNHKWKIRSSPPKSNNPEWITTKASLQPHEVQNETLFNKLFLTPPCRIICIPLSVTASLYACGVARGLLPMTHNDKMHGCLST